MAENTPPSEPRRVALLQGATGIGVLLGGIGILLLGIGQLIDHHGGRGDARAVPARFQMQERGGFGERGFQTERGDERPGFRDDGPGFHSGGRWRFDRRDAPAPGEAAPGTSSSSKAAPAQKARAAKRARAAKAAAQK